MKYPYQKCELHVHLDGSFHSIDAWEIAKAYHIDTGYATFAEYDAHAHVELDCDSLYTYLACFDVPLRLLQYKDALEECAYCLGKRMVKDQVRYAEVRFAPQQHIREHMTQEDAVQAVLHGFARIMKEAGITIQTILCMMVLPQETQKENEETLRLCKSYIHHGVCALDLAGAEGVRRMSEFSQFFAEAKRCGIPLTIHAGENGYPDHIAEALSYGADRIGHGVHVIEDQALLHTCVDQQIPLEVCYTSNLQCHVFPKGVIHPVRKLFDAGIPISINTDNRSISHTSLDQEYDLLEQHFSFTIEELRQCNHNAIQAAFLSEEEKQVILQDL